MNLINLPDDFIKHEPKYKLFQTVFALYETGIYEFFITGIKGEINEYADTPKITDYKYYSQLNKRDCSKKYENQLFATKEELLASL